MLHGNGNGRKGGVPIFISNRMSFKRKTVAKSREEHYIMVANKPRLKISICKHDYYRASTYMNEKLHK